MRRDGMATEFDRASNFAFLLSQQFEAREGSAVASAVADRNKDPTSALGGIDYFQAGARDATGETVDLGEDSIEGLADVQDQKRTPGLVRR